MIKKITVSSIIPVERLSMKMEQDEYLEHIGKYVALAGKKNSDISCLPEDFASQKENPEPITGPIARFIRDLAKKYKMYIIMPIMERFKGRNYNSAILIDRSGEVAGRYFKTHPIPNEMKQFKVSRGSNIPVFKTDFGLIGIMICFDSYFPELPAILARKGARIIFFPHQQDTPDHKTYLLHLRAHAMFNCVYIVASTFGIKRGRHLNQSNNYPGCIIGPDGDIISCKKGEGVITVTIDIERKWMVEGHGESGVKDMKYILAKYRRPELYRKEEPKRYG